MRTLIVLAAIVALALPASAAASTASRDGATITITAGPEDNHITTGHGMFGTGIIDTAGIVPGPGCTAYSDGVSCGSLYDAVIVADLGDGDDEFGNMGLGGAVIHGGPGNDEIGGTSGDDRLYGDAGSDTLYGENGDDTVDGGPGLDQIYGDGFYYDVGGNDTLNSRDGEKDEVSCGMGVDTVTADALDDIYVECDIVDRGEATPPPDESTPPAAGRLPTMTVAAARRHARGQLADMYRAWRRGSQKALASPRRLSRVAIRFRSVSVRFHGRTYRGWAKVKYFWNDGDVFVRTTARLRR